MSARTPLSKISVLAISSATLLISGCDDPLKSASLIEETRVLGARVEVAGDPTRGSPGPGERAHFRLFVAAPDGAPNVAYAFALCGVTPTNSGFPTCKTTLFATAFQADPSTANPEFDFDVPADLDVTAIPHGFVSGIVCPDVGAELTADGGARCTDGPGASIGFEFDFAGPGQDNGNPTFTADSLTLDAAPWAASDPNATCDTLPPAAAGTTRGIGIRLQDTDFDSLVRVSPEDPTRETLLISQFSSAGKLAHTFGSLTPSSPALTSQVSWTAPAKADAGGSVVHFYFVVRDSRGGEDLATRALCVVP
jgi:hypothetical protein